MPSKQVKNHYGATGHKRLGIGASDTSGWICPRCKVAHAPFVSKCGCKSFWNYDLSITPCDKDILFLTRRGGVFQEFIYGQPDADALSKGADIVAWALTPRGEG